MSEEESKPEPEKASLDLIKQELFERIAECCWRVPPNQSSSGSRPKPDPKFLDINRLEYQLVELAESQGVAKELREQMYFGRIRPFIYKAAKNQTTVTRNVKRALNEAVEVLKLGSVLQLLAELLKMCISDESTITGPVGIDGVEDFPQKAALIIKLAEREAQESQHSDEGEDSEERAKIQELLWLRELEFLKTDSNDIKRLSVKLQFGALKFTFAKYAFKECVFELKLASLETVKVNGDNDLSTLESKVTCRHVPDGCTYTFKHHNKKESIDEDFGTIELLEAKLNESSNGNGTAQLQAKSLVTDIVRIDFEDDAINDPEKHTALRLIDLMVEQEITGDVPESVESKIDKYTNCVAEFDPVSRDV